MPLVADGIKVKYTITCIDLQDIYDTYVTKLRRIYFINQQPLNSFRLLLFTLLRVTRHNVDYLGNCR